MPASIKNKTTGYQPQELTFNTNTPVDINAAVSGSKKFEVTAYNGGALSLSNFEHAAYIELDSVEMHGDGSQQPILKDHDTRKIVGHGMPVVTSTNLRVTAGVISHDNDSSREILAAASKGFQWQCSVGGKMRLRPIKIQAGQSRRVNGRNVSGPAYVVRGFLWRETSLVGIGCDDERASARIAASTGALTMDFEKWAEDKGFNVDSLDQDQVNSLKAMFDSEKTLTELKASQASDEAKAQKAKADKDKIEAAAASGNDDETAEEKRIRRVKKDRVEASIKASAASDDIDGLDGFDPEVAAQAASKKYIETVRAARRAEDKRVEDLEGVMLEYEDHVPRMIRAELFDKALAGEFDRNQFELQLIKKARLPKSNTVAAGPYRSREFDTSVVEAALLRSGGMQDASIEAAIRKDVGESRVEEVMNKASDRDMRGFGLQDLVFASIEAAGESIPSRRMNSETIQLAMRLGQQQTDILASSGASTVSLPGILSRIANKQLLQAYSDAMSVYDKICSTTDTSDFKQFDSYRMTESGVLEPVGPNGEVKHSTLGQDSFSNRVVNHAKLIGLTQEMITNDDLGAFQALSRQFGRMAAHAIHQAVIQTLTEAPTAAGAGAATDFFRSAALGNSQPNFLTGAGTALNVDTLSSAWELFANQTDSGGKPVMLEPGVLLTTTGNAVLARNLYNSAEVRIAGSADRTRLTTNPWQSQFDPVTSPYLHQAQFNGGTANTTQWYLIAAGSEDFAPLQIAYLNGQRAPIIEEFAFQPNLLGATLRAVLPFGIALMDPRCVVKSAGTPAA